MNQEVLSVASADKATPLKVALIGYGWWGAEAYTPAIQQDGRAEIVAVCARSEATLDKARSSLGDSLRLYTCLTTMLAEETLDAVFLAVPDKLHEQYLLQVIQSGVPTFYEPPISHEAARIPIMVDKLLSAPQLLHGDTELVYAPVFAKAFECAQSGLLGDIRHINLRLNSSWGPLTDNGLSLMNNIAPWYIDVICRVVNQLPLRVMVFEDQEYIQARTQSQSQAVLDFGRVSATFRANIASAAVSDETVLEVYGTEGELTASYFTGEFRLRVKGDQDWRSEQIDPTLPIAGWPGMHESVKDFFDALLSGGQTQNNPVRMAQLCAIGAAAEQSRNHRNWVDIDYPQC
ncbi:Gfo/Idh/MocA family oxidoreductase [Endozoicomonas sp. GU-1]|uniref:Gfo/Idh/MocA family protein n=1 Tax=Endozoicomonas sp. GU-1 TaxID=3009078 RepID=UPI0022B5DC74|nr:Gfo/Idh/MocA family oxidoreductase [Endozoicomonas sp. GU-1]WBA80311.1 Gfo/Idh/MocA family oxidoreductase [Endozoicomonas sp. GU-1]WBA87882.1 Gfo/Idh/MocA family oxidoreductase [Endozoicomonas sp. GU-1]